MVELSDLGIAIAVAGLGGRQEKDWLISTIEDRMVEALSPELTKTVIQLNLRGNQSFFCLVGLFTGVTSINENLVGACS